MTSWDGSPVTHVPSAVTIDSKDDQHLTLHVHAPFFDDPAPPADHNSSYIGLWDYEGGPALLYLTLIIATGLLYITLTSFKYCNSRLHDNSN